MWYANEKYVEEVEDVNKQLLKLEGSLDDKDARITLAKFLRNNLSFKKRYPSIIANIGAVRPNIAVNEPDVFSKDTNQIKLENVIKAPAIMILD